MQRSIRALVLLPPGFRPTTTLAVPVLDIDEDGPPDGIRALAVDVTALLEESRAHGAPFVSVRFSALEDCRFFGDGSGI